MANERGAEQRLVERLERRGVVGPPPPVLPSGLFRRSRHSRLRCLIRALLSGSDPCARPRLSRPG